MQRIPEGTEGAQAAACGPSLDDLAREGARRMLVAAWRPRWRTTWRGSGRRAMSGGTPRWCGTATASPEGDGRAGLAVRAPRVDDRRVVAGEKQTFGAGSCRIVRRSPKVAEVLPRFTCAGCRRGTSSGAAWPARRGRSGLSPTTITRLVNVWEAEYDASRRELTDRDYVYIWADGVHFNVRLEDDRLARWS